ncbi:hypothetical protein EIN_018170 [Entamoeba invadens IP1]|uniref:hypothetical protein n=1 Tax=Entamoeba invadens IP1 TaxID=370355 RepID=UPI0002C3E1A9|nr:hypothetical protein EIN_018170 [Entamoeba invadens IP1]ELP90468.1 hypothetical protein EIN_018170 [Entamoeba invadens IP1]|eukprot:XP_004257239.1 hypothetical protein EIN_018170 [Entamoeba invadens IP1]
MSEKVDRVIYLYRKIVVKILDLSLFGEINFSYVFSLLPKHIDDAHLMHVIAIFSTSSNFMEILPDHFSFFLKALERLLIVMQQNTKAVVGVFQVALILFSLSDTGVVGSLKEITLDSILRCYQIYTKVLSLRPEHEINRVVNAIDSIFDLYQKKVEIITKDTQNFLNAIFSNGTFSFNLRENALSVSVNIAISSPNSDYARALVPFFFRAFSTPGSRGSDSLEMRLAKTQFSSVADAVGIMSLFQELNKKAKTKTKKSSRDKLAFVAIHADILENFPDNEVVVREIKKETNLFISFGRDQNSYVRVAVLDLLKTAFLNEIYEEDEVAPFIELIEFLLNDKHEEVLSKTCDVITSICESVICEYVDLNVFLESLIRLSQCGVFSVEMSAVKAIKSEVTSTFKKSTLMYSIYPEIVSIVSRDKSVENTLLKNKAVSILLSFFDTNDEMESKDVGGMIKQHFGDLVMSIYKENYLPKYSILWLQTMSVVMRVLSNLNVSLSLEYCCLSGIEKEFCKDMLDVLMFKSDTDQSRCYEIEMQILNETLYTKYSEKYYNEFLFKAKSEALYFISWVCESTTNEVGAVLNRTGKRFETNKNCINVLCQPSVVETLSQLIDTCYDKSVRYRAIRAIGCITTHSYTNKELPVKIDVFLEKVKILGERNLVDSDARREILGCIKQFLKYTKVFTKESYYKRFIMTLNMCADAALNSYLSNNKSTEHEGGYKYTWMDADESFLISEYFTTVESLVSTDKSVLPLLENSFGMKESKIRNDKTNKSESLIGLQLFFFVLYTILGVNQMNDSYAQLALPKFLQFEDKNTDRVIAMLEHLLELLKMSCLKGFSKEIEKKLRGYITTKDDKVCEVANACLGRLMVVDPTKFTKTDVMDFARKLPSKHYPNQTIESFFKLYNLGKLKDEFEVMKIGLWICEGNNWSGEWEMTESNEKLVKQPLRKWNDYLDDMSERGCRGALKPGEGKFIDDLVSVGLFA